MCDSGTCAVNSANTVSASDSDYLPPLSVLKGLKLVELTSSSSASSTTDSDSLWKDQSCLIYLVRRPGCALCRNKAKELGGLRDQLKEKGIGMAAVVHEELGVEEFRAGFWSKDPIYLNSDLSLFAAINDDRKVRKQGLLSGLFSSDMWSRVRQAKAAGVEGNLKGEGRILGGILLMGRGESGPKWIRTEKSFGNHATNEEILNKPGYLLMPDLCGDRQMFNLAGNKKYEKEPEMVYSYGTAGFRMNAGLMKPVAFRVGLLAALLSRFYEGKFVGVMVTASHNPIEDNGVKLVDPNGEMVVGIWEDLATELANTCDADLPSVLHKICNEMKISVNSAGEIKVVVGRDTRPSGIELCEAIEFGVKSVNSGAKFIDLGLQSTPQLHFSVKELNDFGKADGYIEHFSKQFELILEGRRLEGKLVIDAANGIGAQSSEAFKKRLKDSTGFDPTILNSGEGDEDILNCQCGADFVKIQMKPPKGVKAEKGARFASLDGDADRLIYFYFNEDCGEFKMLDGDRISVLFAFYLRKLLKEAGLFDSLKFGVVQTAYANGASTDFLREQGISVAMACTGVKNLHHVAAEEYDIGVYFEANGHGTVLFGPRALEVLDQAPKLKIVKNLVNQCVGDALSDLLFVEAILCEETMSLAAWDALYTELPSRQLKVKVKDRAGFKTTAADTKLTEPPYLQPQIDQIVAQVPFGRAFVRPSGTEDVVRVYAEAGSRDEADALAQRISDLIQNNE